MNQTEKAKRFAELHIKGEPLVLHNAWDAGSAKTIHDAGAKAIATSSWSVAAAQGYGDGEAMPIEFAEQIAGRIAATVDIPVTVDFEGGYSEDDGELTANISRLLDLHQLRRSDRQGLGALQRRPASGPHLGHSESGAGEGSWSFHQRSHGRVFRTQRGRSEGHQ